MKLDTGRAYTKAEALTELLQHHRSVFVHLDARAEGVIVPPPFKKEPDLALELGLNLPVPVTDLKIDEDEWSATLSFDRSFFCVVPWEAVYLIVADTGYGCAWDQDVPQEVLDKLVEDHQQERPGAPSAPAPKKTPRTLPAGWKVHEGGA